MYQDGAILEMIQSCKRSLVKYAHLGNEYVEAITKALEFWLSIKENLKAEIERKAGFYVTVRAGNVVHDEWTNIGVMVFDSEGQLVFRRMGPFARAIYRGDLKEYYVRHLNDYGKHYDLEQVKQILKSDGHYMGAIQMAEPRATILEEENYQSIYQDFVLGLVK